MKYTVTAPFIELHSGVLNLTKGQAAVRAHNLRRTRTGYEIVRPVQFKAGEQIGYDGELTHAMAEALSAKPDSVQTSAQNADIALPGIDAGQGAE